MPGLQPQDRSTIALFDAFIHNDATGQDTDDDDRKEQQPEHHRQPAKRADSVPARDDKAAGAAVAASPTGALPKPESVSISISKCQCGGSDHRREAGAVHGAVKREDMPLASSLSTSISTQLQKHNTSTTTSGSDHSSLSSAISTTSSSDLSAPSPFSEPPSSNTTSPISQPRVLIVDLDSHGAGSEGGAASIATTTGIDRAEAKRVIKGSAPDGNSSSRNSTSSPCPGNTTSTTSSSSDREMDGMILQGRAPPPPPSQGPSSHSSGGKGGCWTCRIRRKKCDEQRVNDSCQTCIRLRIDCLGWGPKRPPWMRDKQAVEQYKAGIKEKLIKAGMVRGQPRTPVASASSAGTVAAGGGPSSASSSASMQHRPFSDPGGGAGPSRHGLLGMGGGVSPPHSHYRPYPNPHSLPHAQQLQNPMLAHPGALGINAAPNTPASQLRMFSSPSSLNLNLGGVGVGEASLNIDYSREIAQTGMIHQGASYSPTAQQQQRIAQHTRQQHQQQLSMRMTPGRGSISSGTSSPHGSMSSPFNFSSPSSSQLLHHQSSHLTPSHDLQQGMFPELYSSNMELGLGPSAMSGNGGMAGRSVNMDMSNLGGMGVDATHGMTSESLLLEMGMSSGFLGQPQGQRMLQTRANSLPNPQNLTAGGTPSTSAQLQLTGSGSSGSPAFNSALMDQSFMQPHVGYYIESVLPMQYPFQYKSAAAVINEIFQHEPQGPLINASCALASHHNKTLRVSRMLEQPDPVPQESTAAQFYDRAYWQLANKMTQLTNSTQQSISEGEALYSASEALAALHCVAYFLMQGGIGDWPSLMCAARHWLEKTAGKFEDPKRMFAGMNDAERLTLKVTIWYDTFSAISLHQAPRFLNLCRRLLSGAGGAQYSNTHQLSSASDGTTDVNLNMELLMGCPDRVMLALAEIAELAHWKQLERVRGSLSTRELLRRGDAIEELLRRYQVDFRATQQQTATNATREHNSGSHMHPSRPSGEHNGLLPDTASQLVHMNVVGPTSGSAGASGPNVSATLSAPLATATTQSFSPGMNTMGNDVSSDLMNEVMSVFHATAALYLQTVINEPSPGVPEVGDALTNVVQALQNLSSPSFDRALVLPVTLAACCTDNREQRIYCQRMLTKPEPSIGNSRNAKILAEQVWQRRDSQGGVVDWRLVMKEMGSELLLV